MLGSEHQELIPTDELQCHHVPIGSQLMIKDNLPVALVLDGKEGEQVGVVVDSEEMEEIKSGEVLGVGECEMMDGLLKMDFLFEL